MYVIVTLFPSAIEPTRTAGAVHLSGVMLCRPILVDQSITKCLTQLINTCAIQSLSDQHFGSPCDHVVINFLSFFRCDMQLFLHAKNFLLFSKITSSLLICFGYLRLILTQFEEQCSFISFMNGFSIKQKHAVPFIFFLRPTFTIHESKHQYVVFSFHKFPNN